MSTTLTGYEWQGISVFSYFHIENMFTHLHGILWDVSLLANIFEHFQILNPSKLTHVKSIKQETRPQVNMQADYRKTRGCGKQCIAGANLNRFQQAICQSFLDVHYPNTCIPI